MRIDLSKIKYIKFIDNGENIEKCIGSKTIGFHYNIEKDKWCIQVKADNKFGFENYDLNFNGEDDIMELEIVLEED